MEYYYANPENIDKNNRVIILEGFVYRHLIQVLRKKKNDKLVLTDGLRNIYYAVIVEINKENLFCTYSETEHNVNEPELYINLFSAPLRNAERFEFLVEKAVELGVSEIYPVYTKNTVKKGDFSSSYMKRLEKIIIGAMGQSQRCFKPVLHESINFESVLDMYNGNPNRFFFHEFAEQDRKAEIDMQNKQVNIFVGPEGGFAINESEMLIKNNWKPCSLGPRKFRAETAAIIGTFEILNYKKENL
ncbi:MAG: 16S rRNA (uracil(1498)-N(3))-methyltransferase [Ignavibacteria bacterium]|nr:16S rRNA (uracil(1498)-N(3))-methyltransferase [Ignavibacteria bacterium]